LDRHHIIFKSEAGWHKEINNPLNIVQCCRSCHLKFHSKNLDRSPLILERGLDKLFSELNLLK
jgi:5-methylcytosine-specific restriction endonuclease McrA